MKLYILQHEREDSEFADDTKLIGIYSSKDAAEAAVRWLEKLPGFSKVPQGFYTDAYEVDKDHWTEGFGSGVNENKGARDVPNWALVERPRSGESGNDFAKRLMDAKHGPGNYEIGPTSEFGKVRIWGNRSFQNP